MPKELTKGAAWLEEQFVAWRGKQTSLRASVEMFCRYLGISRDDFYNVRKGQSLSQEKADLVAEALGSEEVYAVFDLKPPNPLRRLLDRLFDSLSDESKEELIRQAELLRKREERRGRGSDATEQAMENGNQPA